MFFIPVLILISLSPKLSWQRAEIVLKWLKWVGKSKKVKKQHDDFRQVPYRLEILQPILFINLFPIFFPVIFCLFATDSLANDRFGSFAVCPLERICAWSRDYSTPEGAEAAALRACKEKGGRECKIKKTFKNTCAALALAQDNKAWGYATGPSIAQTRRRAIFECRKYAENCVVSCSVCTEREKRISVQEQPEVIIVPPPERGLDGDRRRFNCYCCWKEMTGGQVRDPRTGRTIMVDRVVNRCAWMSPRRCRTMGLGGGQCR